MADISQVKLPNGDTYNLVDKTSGYIKNYTETDPVFSASAAAGITSTDISNWNSKTSNTGTVTSIGITNGGGLSISGSPVTSSGTITIGHSNSVTAQTTQAVYPIKIDAQGHISAYGSAVTIPTVPSNIVNTITTTAGAHTTISSSKGNVSFNVPTKTSHLTNDSGFITTDTKNTAGSTDSSSKLFLIGATSQAANPQTYSHDTAYVGTDGCLYSGGAKTLVNNYSAGEYTYLSFTTDVVETQGVEARALLTIQSSSYDGSLYRVLNYQFNSHEFTIYSQTLDKTFIDIINYSDNNFGDNNVGIHNLRTPTANADAATKKYVDDSIPKVYSSTNTGGYLTMATLPIYDGTVV